MTPLPGPLGGQELVCWRLERSLYVPTWRRAEGARRDGGRWHSAGRRVLYTALDPATAIVEVAVHRGFDVLDRVPHKLLRIRINDPVSVRVLRPADVPNRLWLSLAKVSANQQSFGDSLLAESPIWILPSAVSRYSWNLIIDTDAAKGRFELVGSEAFALDTRLATPPVALPATSRTRVTRRRQ